MATIKIPDRYRKALTTITSLEDEAIQGLVAALSKVGSSIIGEEMLDGIANDVAKDSFQDARVLVDALLSLYVLKANTDISSEQIAQDVAHALLSEGVASEPEAEQSIVNRFITLLSVDTMDICAKATDLQSESGRIFADARVVTDIRPVFGTSVGTPPVGVVLVHNLKIKYIEGGESKELFFALDCQDIASLMSVLERARNKEKTLGGVLSSSNLTVVASQEKPNDASS